MRDFVYKLVITCETREEAETILGARIGYDEELDDVGEYSIDATAIEEAGKPHPEQRQEDCKRCGGHGMIGWHTGQTPEQFEQHEAECPDCTPHPEPAATQGDGDA